MNIPDEHTLTNIRIMDDIATRGEYLNTLPAIVHSGHFHADEVMAVAMLKCLGLLDGTIVRTRNAEVIDAHHNKAYILDVGGVDDPENLRFDHHQRGFERYYSEHAQDLGVKMSSCGLLYKFLGPAVFTRYISDRMGENLSYSDMVSVDTDVRAFRDLVNWCRDKALFTEEKLMEWCDHFYNKYIMEIDANDNGVNVLSDEYDGVLSKSVFRYTTSWRLPSIIGDMNKWNIADTGDLAVEQDVAFKEAVNVCADLFSQALFKFLMSRMSYEQALWKLQDIVNHAVANAGGLIPQRTDVPESEFGRYVIVPSADGRVYYSMLILYEKFDYNDAANELFFGENSETHRTIVDMDDFPIKWMFTVLPREADKNDRESDTWQIHTVRTGYGFGNRASILSSDMAAREIGEDQLVFVHNARFIAVTRGLGSAEHLARASILDHDNKWQSQPKPIFRLQNVRQYLEQHIDRRVIIAAVAGFVLAYSFAR